MPDLRDLLALLAGPHPGPGPMTPGFNPSASFPSVRYQAPALSVRKPNFPVDYSNMGNDYGQPSQGPQGEGGGVNPLLMLADMLPQMMQHATSQAYQNSDAAAMDAGNMLPPNHPHQANLGQLLGTLALAFGDPKGNAGALFGQGVTNNLARQDQMDQTAFEAKRQNALGRAQVEANKGNRGQAAIDRLSAQRDQAIARGDKFKLASQEDATNRQNKMLSFAQAMATRVASSPPEAIPGLVTQFNNAVKSMGAPEWAYPEDYAQNTIKSAQGAKDRANAYIAFKSALDGYAKAPDTANATRFANTVLGIAGAYPDFMQYTGVSPEELKAAAANKTASQKGAEEKTKDLVATRDSRIAQIRANIAKIQQATKTDTNRAANIAKATDLMDDKLRNDTLRAEKYAASIDDLIKNRPGVANAKNTAQKLSAIKTGLTAYSKQRNTVAANQNKILLQYNKMDPKIDAVQRAELKKQIDWGDEQLKALDSQISGLQNTIASVPADQTDTMNVAPAGVTLGGAAPPERRTMSGNLPPSAVEAAKRFPEATARAAFKERIAKGLIDAAEAKARFKALYGKDL